jgi:hypothetical protein
MSDFTATLLGSAFGVVAGAFIQYLVTIWLSRHNRQKNLKDLKTEAKYNLRVAEQMLEQVRRMRVAAQPATFNNFVWLFRAKDMLSIALTRIIASGDLYKMFTEQEILRIQLLVEFFNAQTDEFITNRLASIKSSNDIAEAHRFADWLEGQITERIGYLNQFLAK